MHQDRQLEEIRQALLVDAAIAREAEQCYERIAGCVEPGEVGRGLSSRSMMRRWWLK